MQPGSLEGLGPLLPPGGLEAELIGDRTQAGRFAIFVYQGPDGYPPRFLHLLLDDPLPLAIFRYDASEERWLIYIPGGPAFVNEIDHFNDGDELWARFASPEGD